MRPRSRCRLCGRTMFRPRTHVCQTCSEARQRAVKRPSTPKVARRWRVEPVWMVEALLARQDVLRKWARGRL
jgi:ribosomal protein L37E